MRYSSPEPISRGPIHGAAVRALHLSPLTKLLMAYYMLDDSQMRELDAVIIVRARGNQFTVHTDDGDALLVDVASSLRPVAHQLREGDRVRVRFDARGTQPGRILTCYRLEDAVHGNTQ